MNVCPALDFTNEASDVYLRCTAWAVAAFIRANAMFLLNDSENVKQGETSEVEVVGGMSCGRWMREFVQPMRSREVSVIQYQCVIFCGL